MIVVTGASGLVGANMVRALLAQGHTVRALVHHDRRAVQGLEVEQVAGDVRDAQSLLGAFRNAEVVFHLAGCISLEMDSWPEVEAVNVAGTRHVAAACLQCGVRRLVHFSSIHALEDEPLDTPVDETRRRVEAPGLPPYSLSKAAAEKEVAAAQHKGLETVVLNPTGIVGPFDYKPSFFGQAVLGLAKGRIPALVQGGFDWVDVRDVVAGAIQAGLHASSGANYILSGHWHSVQEVARMVQELTGWAAPHLVVPTWLAYQAAPLMRLAARFFGTQPIYTRVSLLALRSNRQVSSARAQHELGYHVRSFRDTLADTLVWFSDNGYLRKPPGLKK